MRSSGLLIVDKSPGGTSFGVVKVVKKLFNCNKVGHTGTLDPIATGILPICLGAATKLSSLVMATRKEYDVWATFGKATDSHDHTGAVTEEKPWEHLTREQVIAAIPKFVGEIKQLPPMFSAVKIKGRPLYWYARRGEVIEDRQVRDCTIWRFELTDWQPPRVRFYIECSSGTYVRTLVHDLAITLGSAAVVQELRRTAVGALRLEQSITIAELEAMDIAQRWQKVLPMSQALPDLPNYIVSPQLVRRLKSGEVVMWRDVSKEQPSHKPEELFKLIDGEGNLVAVAANANAMIKTVRVF